MGALYLIVRKRGELPGFTAIFTVADLLVLCCYWSAGVKMLIHQIPHKIP
jgi:hypothetical protein